MLSSTIVSNSFYVQTLMFPVPKTDLFTTRIEFLQEKLLGKIHIHLANLTEIPEASLQYELESCANMCPKSNF